MSEEIDENQAAIEKANEKKQNDILARREARRRRILENAKSRLDKVSGADRDAASTNKTTSYSEETYSDPEIEHPEYMNNFNPTYATTSAAPSQVDWESAPLLNPRVAAPLTKFEKFLSSRLHVAAISVVTYALLALGLNAVISHSLFVLFLTLECTELVFFRRDQPLNPIVSMVLMLSGINVSKAGVLIKLFGILNKMVCDLGLFIFCFVVSHGLCGFMGGNIEETFYSF